MNNTELREGLRSLNAMAAGEYHQSLNQVAMDSDEHRAAVRVGRLVGVILKEPFASARDRDTPSARSAAFKEWDLVRSAEEFATPERIATWQYKALEELKTALVGEEPRLKGWSVYDFAIDAHNERGFFGYFARAVRHYICGNRRVRRNVRRAIKDARKGGVSITDMSPELVIASGGAALGTYLVTEVPFLGFVGVPVIAGLVVILYRLGVEGFCDWSASLRTDEDEKH